MTKNAGTIAGPRCPPPLATHVRVREQEHGISPAALNVLLEMGTGGAGEAKGRDK